MVSVGMYEGNPNNNISDGKEFWAKVTYRSEWSKSKQGTKPVPIIGDKPAVIDSISYKAPNNDTTYKASIEGIYSNDDGIINMFDFMGWLSRVEDSLQYQLSVTADKNFTLPLAFIDSITPNPALLGSDISFKGYGTYGTNPSPPITNAVWRTNRSEEPLHTCEKTPECNFVYNDLDFGQHLISFSVVAMDTIASVTNEKNSSYVLKINTPPLASIISIKSTGKKGDIVKSVKWDDNEGHDPITFVGQVTDLDGFITEYEWKSKLEGNTPLGSEKSFSYNSLTKFGIHTITFRAKDNNGKWSNIVEKKIELIKPPVLLVHGFLGSPEGWKWQEGEKVNGYTIHRLGIEPYNKRFSYGAEKISEKIKELTTQYGIPKINLVVHSMGGLNSRWYIQNHGFRNDVNKLVMLGTPNHGSMLTTLLRPMSSGKHDPIGFFASLMGADFFLKNLIKIGVEVIGGAVGGSAAIDLSPQSSALIALNGNKKDEGYTGNEPLDNISTVYGNKVPYFNIKGNSWPGLNHYHVTENIVVPSISFYTDIAVHEDSLYLDGIPMAEVDGINHMGLTEDKEPLKKALEYLGSPVNNTKRGIRKADRKTREKVNISEISVGHMIYAPENGDSPTINTGESIEQPFEVDATINNLHVMLMVTSENKPSLYLMSPNGEIINANTTLSNVTYENDNSIGTTYHINDIAEPGTWTAIIESTSTESTQYTLLVTGETNFWVGIEEGTQVKPGEPFKIAAYAQKDGNPISGLSVTATLINTLDEGERIGKYGTELRSIDPIEVTLNDIGNGNYELSYGDTNAPGAYQVFITATDGEGNSRTAFTTFFIEYDFELAIQSDDITFPNEPPEHNEIIEVSATIHNESGLETKGVEIWFSDGKLNEDGNIFAKETIETIATGGSETISVPWLATAGEHEIVVIVSPMNTFIETKLENNTASKTIQVNNNPPIADAGIGQTARSDSHVFLDGSGSTDEYEIERYEWDIDTNVDSDNDGIANNDIDLTGVRPFIQAGTYTTNEYNVKLTVFDTANQSASDTLTVKLTDEYDLEPPVASANLEQIPGQSTIYLDGSNSTDNFGIAAYIWDIDINVDSDGDGLPDNDVDLVGKKVALPDGYADKTVTVKLNVADVAGNDTSFDILTINPDEQEPIVIEEGPYRAYGYLRDPVRNPIPNAKIQIGNKTTTTDADGKWEIEGLNEAEYILKASKDGYQIKDKTITIGENREKIGIEARSVLNIDIIPFTKNSSSTGITYLKGLNTDQMLAQGQNIVYLATVTNNGDKAAKEVTITEILPEGSELVSIETLTGGYCNADSCTVSELPIGASATFKAEVKNTQDLLLLNTLQVSSNEYPLDAQITETEIKSYLSVSISDYPDPVEMLQPVNYTIDVELNKYATVKATGIELTITLSPGLELKPIDNENGSCDISKQPVVTCTINDLEIGSKVTFEIDAILKDAGLLLLTNQVDVKSNEYSVHAFIERTEILVPEDIEVDIALVVDATGSMRQEINGIRKGLKDVIHDKVNSGSTLTTLVIFRDHVKVKAFTSDINVLLEAVENLNVWGGGTCPEASIEALDKVIKHVKHKGTIYFVTDASPYADADIDGMLERLKAKNIEFTSVITGDCSNSDSWNLPE